MGGKAAGTLGTVLIPTYACPYRGYTYSNVEASVFKTLPAGIELLIGLPMIGSPERPMVVDVASYRVYIRGSHPEVLRLDFLSRVCHRLHGPQIEMLLLASGLCTELFAALNLGFRVSKALCVEKSERARILASAHSPDIISYHPSNDIQGMPPDWSIAEQDSTFFCVSAGFPTSPWCRSRGPAAQGFKAPEAAVFSTGAPILAEANRLGLHTFSEVVQPADHLTSDLKFQASLTGRGYDSLDARAVGGHHRPRLYSTDASLQVHAPRLAIRP